jgi:hypothetical protein
VDIKSAGFGVLIAMLSSALYAAETGNILGDIKIKLRSTYDSRQINFDNGQDDENDDNLQQYASVFAKNAFVKNLNIFASGRFDADLGLTPLESELRDSVDYRSGGDDFRLDYAYFDYRSNQYPIRFRAGRQTVNDVELVHIDGAKLGLSLVDNKVNVSAFYGSRVSHYSDPEKKEVIGGNISYSPLRSTTIAGNFVHYLATSTELRVDQSFGLDFLTTTRLSWIDSDMRDLTVDASYFSEKSGTNLFFTYFHKIGRDHDDFLFDYTSSDLSGKDLNVKRFFIKDLVPFRDFSIQLEQTVFDNITLSASIQDRSIINNDQEDEFNYPFTIYSIGVGTNGLLVKNSELRFNFTEFDAGLPEILPGADFDTFIGEGEPNYSEITGEFSQRLNRNITLGISFYYRRYDYQTRFLEVTDADSLSFGVHGEWRFRKNGYVQINYGRDDDFKYINPNLDNITRLRVRLALTF